MAATRRPPIGKCGAHAGSAGVPVEENAEFILKCLAFSTMVLSLPVAPLDAFRGRTPKTVATAKNTLQHVRTSHSLLDVLVPDVWCMSR